MASCKDFLYLDDLLAFDAGTADLLLDPAEMYSLGFVHPELLPATDPQCSSTPDMLPDAPAPRRGDHALPAAVYKPARVRGTGRLREGYCEPCRLWLRLKTSSYWYHMNYKHGINSRGVRYPEPQIRYAEHGADAFCSTCNQWVSLGHKTAGKSTRFGWFKHCQKKHGTSK